MGGRKISITVSEELHRALEKEADEQGLGMVSIFVKSVAAKSVQNRLAADGDRKFLTLTVSNFRELSDYVEAKKFGSIESFATFAMAQYMTKYPSKAGKRAESGN